MCCHELMQLLKKMFCGCHRALRYFLFNDKNQEVTETMVTKKFDNDFK